MLISKSNPACGSWDANCFIGEYVFAGAMQPLNSIALWPVAAMVSIAVITDLHSRRIPNWLVLPSLAAGVLVSAIAHGWNGVGRSLLGVLTAAVAMGLFCRLGGLGMGDLKLCAAVGAWIGPSQLFLALVMTGLIGGMMALCLAVAGGFAGQAIRGTASLLFHLFRGFARQALKPHHALVLDNPTARTMPYAPAIAIGTICSFLGRH